MTRRYASRLAAVFAGAALVAASATRKVATDSTGTVWVAAGIWATYETARG